MVGGIALVGVGCCVGGGCFLGLLVSDKTVMLAARIVTKQLKPHGCLRYDVNTVQQGSALVLQQRALFNTGGHSSVERILALTRSPCVFRTRAAIVSF